MDNRVQNYKELIFWKTSFEVTILVIKLTKKLPSSQDIKIISNQLIRASSSVGANIAEGFGRYKGKEYERFLQISLGSANEVEYWLLVLEKVNNSYSLQIRRIMDINSQTIKMLASSLKTLRLKRKTDH